MQRIETLPKIPRRGREGHKGSYGRILVVGGSRRMIGAPALAANAALRGGAGLVTVASPAPVQLAVAMLCECATSIPLACEADGELAAESLSQLRSAMDRADVLAVGPGLAVGKRREDLVRTALEQEDKLVVLDADGLNNLAAMDDWPAWRKCPLVLTPHPGEFARLSGKSIGDVQADREQAVADAHAAWSRTGQPLVIVLKGAGTVVCDGERMYVNPSGNPGMASGGTGDVLTGLVAGLSRQGIDLFEAVCLAVYVHGDAGDRAAEHLTEVSLTASDLLEYIPDAMEDVCE